MRIQRPGMAATTNPETAGRAPRSARLYARPMLTRVCVRTRASTLALYYADDWHGTGGPCSNHFHDQGLCEPWD